MTYLVSPNRINHEIDRMFNHMTSGRQHECCQGDFMPNVDIRETDDDISLTFELPGVDQSDVKVTIENNVLTVAGERKVAEPDEKVTYQRNEISSGTFSRSFTFPRTVDTGSVSADYKNGFLTVAMARKEEAKPKQIDIAIN
jgi:HSP20 family protein